MQDRIQYEFAIIRIVPKVERGEFINTGVMLFSKKKKYIGIKYKVDKEKLAIFNSEIEATEIEKYLNSWKQVCEGATEGGVVGAMEMHLRFRWLTAQRSTIIQSSQVHSGLTENLEVLLEDLFQKYVQ